MSRKELRRFIGYALCGLPLLGVMVADLLPLPPRGQQFLVMIALVWFELFILLEVIFAAR